MSSWSPDIVRETNVHISAATVHSKELCSKNCGQKELGIEEISDLTDSLMKDHKMRDVRDVEHCLGTVVLPSSAKSMGSEDDMLAAAINTAKIFVKDEVMDDLSMDDKEARRRFLHQPWSFLRDCLERSKSGCDTGTEECGAKTKDQKKLAVLPHSKYPLYGYCPSRDEFMVVKCKLCGMAVKPVAHRAHMHLRHNIGLKSPEPTTPVVSVISPPFPSTSSQIADAPALCSNSESMSIAHEQVDSAVAGVPVEKGERTRKANAAQKAACVDPASSPKGIVPATADNYVVVAPHSDDRPLKLTFRRARTNASHSPASSSIPFSSAQIKDRKKPTMAAPPPPSAATIASAMAKSRLRQPNIRSEPLSQNPPPQQPMELSPVAKRSNEKVPESWDHQIAPSTSSASVVESVAIDPVPPPIKVLAPPPSLPPVVSLPSPTIVTNLSTFQNHVYEHPKPLAVSRFEQKPSPQPQQNRAAPELEAKTDYGDHACYFVSSYACSQRRWPTFRRSTQSIRQACRRIFISDGGEDDMVSFRQVPSKITLSNGSAERPKEIEAEVTSNWTLNNGGGPKGHIFDRRSSHVAILRHPPGVSKRMVRVTSAVRNGSTDYHHPAVPVVVSGEKFSPAPPISSTIPNKSYTKVSINQLKTAAAAMESVNGQVALDLGSLMCNGDSGFQFKPTQTTVISAPVKPVINQKRTGVKRPSSTSIMPSTLMTALGPETQMGAKKPRIQHMMRNNSRTMMDVEEVSSVGMGGPIIQNVGIKPSVASLSQAQARQQLVKALQHANNPSTGNRRKPASHGFRHQLTPIVISPSHTPQAGSPHPQQQQQPQQQQVVLVSVNGPAVLTGWHKLTTNTGEQLPQQTGMVQNGLVATMDTSASFGTRVIRPKMTTTNPVTLPVFVTHSEQIQVQAQPYRYSQSVVAQKLATPISNGALTNAYQAKQMAQARFARRSNSTMALDELSQYPVAQQQHQHQQPMAQFRPIQPAQQLAFGHTGGIRSGAVTSAPVIAGQIFLNVASVPKGGLNVTATPTSTVTVGTLIGQQVPRQSSAPTSGAVSTVNAPLNFLAASNAGYVTASNTAPATPGIYS